MSQKRKLFVPIIKAPMFIHSNCYNRKYASIEDKKEYDECGIKICKSDGKYQGFNITFYEEEHKTQFILKYL